MKKKNNNSVFWSQVIIWLCVIALFAGIMFIDKVIFESVTESNLPDWLKWFLLR